MARSKNAQPVAAAADDFDAILARAEAVVAERTRDLPVQEVTADQVEIVKPSRSRSAKKETTPVPAVNAVKTPKAASVSLVPAKPVREPKAITVRENINLAGVNVPVTVTLSDRPLSVLESIVSKGMEAIFNAGVALIEINARGLYREAGFKDWPSYIRERWDMSKSRSYQVMSAAKTIAAAEAAGVPANQLPKTEAAAREFEAVVKTGDPIVIKAAAAEATAGGTKPMTAQTAADAKATVTKATPKITSSASKGRKTAATPARDSAGKGTATGLEPVGVDEGRKLLGTVIKGFMNGTFIRNDNDSKGTVAFVKTMRAYAEAWLAGTSNVVDSVSPRNDKSVIAEVVATLPPPVEVAVPAAAERQKGESAGEYALRIMANPGGVRPEVVAWAKQINAIPASKAEADAKQAKAALETKTAIEVGKAALKKIASAPAAAQATPVKAPKVSAAAQASMDATATARPQTGTQQRRAASKSKAA